MEILRIVFAAKRPNVRAIADKLGSPNRLSGDLVELIQKRYLHMEREGKEHFYTITNPGAKCLAKYEGDTAEASMSSLVDMGNEKEMIDRMLASPRLTKIIMELIKRAPEPEQSKN